MTKSPFILQTGFGQIIELPSRQQNDPVRLP
jgi:hypothetical protein